MQLSVNNVDLTQIVDREKEELGVRISLLESLVSVLQQQVAAMQIELEQHVIDIVRTAQQKHTL